MMINQERTENSEENLLQYNFVYEDEHMFINLYFS
jgi:hypothetical protein